MIIFFFSVKVANSWNNLPMVYCILCHLGVLLLLFFFKLRLNCFKNFKNPDLNRD